MGRLGGFDDLKVALLGEVGGCTVSREVGGAGLPCDEVEFLSDHLLGPLFLFSFFFVFLYHVFIVTVQELACSASYGVKKTLIAKQCNKIKPITNRLQVRQVPSASPT